MGLSPLLNFVKNSYLFDKFYRVGSTVTVESGWMGVINADTFMPIFSACRYLVS